VTARQVLETLVRNKLLHIARDEDGAYEKTALHGATRTVQRWLVRHGYRRGKRTDNIRPKVHVVARQQTYLQEYFANRARPKEQRLREVYMGESYIHHHYHRNEDSLFDPNDEQDIQLGKMPAKGRRYCFAAAIQGPDPRVDPLHPDTPAESKAGIVPNTYWRFCPQSTAQTGDYHKAFNGENFLNWWKVQLLPNLHQPSIIIMDNASYHMLRAAGTPSVNKMKQVEMQAWLREKGEEVDDAWLAPQLKVKCSAYIKEKVPYEVTRLAEEQGHRVLFTPPCMSELQPIEITWGFVKGRAWAGCMTRTRRCSWSCSVWMSSSSC
jgi:transposase